jgi:hypothetical protein
MVLRAAEVGDRAGHSVTVTVCILLIVVLSLDRPWPWMDSRHLLTLNLYLLPILMLFGHTILFLDRGNEIVLVRATGLFLSCVGRLS